MRMKALMRAHALACALNGERQTQRTPLGTKLSPPCAHQLPPSDALGVGRTGWRSASKMGLLAKRLRSSPQASTEAERPASNVGAANLQNARASHFRSLCRGRHTCNGQAKCSLAMDLNVAAPSHTTTIEYAESMLKCPLEEESEEHEWAIEG